MHQAGAAFGAVSEGEQRMVLLARAVVKRPSLLVLDEPCQGLDAAYRERLLAAVDEAGHSLDASVIYVTHDPLALPGIISHVLKLDAGRVALQGRLNGHDLWA
jgi:ABC-type molybdenum transport system ATPase subunit/photorepair protein PhrA